tara:strand:- start:105 stop:317 length:213 start_codon:yes stop_codon:yes gene_type:complete
MKNKENIMKNNNKKRTNEKRTPKNDLGYGTKKVTLDEIGMTSSEFDLLDGMFGGNPVEEFEDIMDGIFDE